MRIFVRLLIIIMPEWLSMLAATLFAVLTVAANVGLMGAAAYLIAAAALHPPLAALSPTIAGVRFFGLSRAVFRYLERFVAHDATFRLLSRIRVWFYDALEPLAPARLAGFRSGELLSRIANDVETLQFFYLRVLLPPAVALFTLAGMSLALMSFGKEFVYLLAAGFGCAGVLLPLALYCISRGSGKGLPQARSLLIVTLVDSIRGMRDLASFNQTERQARQVALAGNEYINRQRRTASMAGLADAGGHLIMNLTLLGAVVVAIPLVNSGRIDGVYLALLALGIQSSFEAVLPMATAYRYWEESLAAAGRMFDVIDAKPAVVGSDMSSSQPDCFDLEAVGIKFRYRERLPLALDDVSFTLPDGGRLAIVGPSGAGKSSLVALLLRFWDYEAGVIRLGGKAITDYNPQALRDYISVIPQQTHIFNASIGDNIRLARPSASMAEVAEAAEQAALGAVLQALPHGLDSLLGENGHGLSGGERRRLAIARALLKNPPLLVLDEPTAGLDPVTEREVMGSIRKLMVGRTIILITHRLIGLEEMDEILVFDQGRVVERGSQDELLQRKGLFYTMWQMQNDSLPESF